MKSCKLALSILFGLAVIGAAGYFGFFGFQPPATPAKANTAATPPPTVPVSKGDVRQLVSAPGTVAGTQKMNLVTGVQGRIDEINVRPGDSVKKGQTLARLADPGKYEALVDSTHIDLAKARQDLEDLRAAAPKDTADAQTALLKAEDDLTKAKNLVEALKYPRASQTRLDSTYADYQSALEQVAMAQDSYDKLAALPPDDPRRVEALKAMTEMQKKKDQLLGVYNWLTAKPTEKDKADAEAKLDIAQAGYDAAQRKWERVKNGPDAMALDLAQAKVASAEKAYAQAKDDLAHLTLTAPFDGIITDVKAAVGDQVTDAG